LDTAVFLEDLTSIDVSNAGGDKRKVSPFLVGDGISFVLRESIHFTRVLDALTFPVGDNLGDCKWS
jgi:hypothetical protein